MNRVFLSLLKSVSVAVLAASCVAAYASTEAAAPKVDLAKGEALFANGDTARGIVACSTCHGAGGNSTISVNPKLAGQHAAYIAKQLHDFTTPDRMNPVMSTFAKAMSDEDKQNVAAYVNAQKPKAGFAKNKDIVELGKKIFRGGIAEKNVPACAGCHGPSGAGIPVQFPRLAGQHQDYTYAQLVNFGTDKRKNSVQMTVIAKHLSDDEMKAVSDYIAGLK